MHSKKYALTKKACYLGYIIQAVVNNLTSLLFVIFNAEPFGLTQEELGRLVFINFVSQLVIDALSIYIVPKAGYRKCVVFAQASSAVGFILLGILPNILPPYLGLVIAILFLAMGSGFIEVLISPIIEALPSNNKAGSMSFLHSFYCWGQAATVAVTTVILLVIGRDKWYYLPFLWSVLPIINVFLFSRATILELEGDKNHSFSLKCVLKEKDFYLFILLMFCGGASELAMVQWSSFFAELGFGVDKWLGDLAGPCMFAVFMGLGRVGYAIFGGKIKPRKIIMISAAVCVTCYITVALSNLPVFSILACSICGISVSVMWPGMFSVAAERFKGSGAAMFSVLAMFGDLGCATGPWLLGMVSEISTSNGFVYKFAEIFNITGNQPGLQLGFLVTAIIPLMMFICLLFLCFRKKV